MLPFAFAAAQRSARRLYKIAHRNGTARKQGLRTLCAPRDCLQFDRSQMACAKGTRAATSRQRSVNQSSTKRQPSVNGTSNGHQRNVNGTSNRRFSRRDTKESHFGGHQRNTQSGLVDGNAVSGYAGRSDLSFPDPQRCGRETCRVVRPVVPRGLLGSGVQDSIDANATVRSVVRWDAFSRSHLRLGSMAGSNDDEDRER